MYNYLSLCSQLNLLLLLIWYHPFVLWPALQWKEMMITDLLCYILPYPTFCFQTAFKLQKYTLKGMMDPFQSVKEVRYKKNFAKCSWQEKRLSQRVLNDLQRSRLSCGGRMTRLLAHPLPSPLRWSGCLSFSVFLCFAGRAYWLGEGRGRWGAISCYRKKAWSSINHAILSGLS